MTLLQVRPPNSTDSSTEQPQGHVQSGQSTEGAQPGPQQGTAQRAHAAGQPQQAEQHAAATDPPGQQRHSVSIQMSGDNPADLVAAITSALSNQERDSTDHLVSGSGSTGSMSSLVVSQHLLLTCLAYMVHHTWHAGCMVCWWIEEDS